MKKSFMIFVCFVLVFSMTLVSAHHNLDNTFEISQETIQTGEQVTNLNSNLFSLNEEHGETFSLNFFKRWELSREMTQIAEDRKEKMILLAQENPVLFFSNAFDYEERKKFPSRVQILIEDEVEVEGELSIWHFDDFTDPKNPTATFHHSIIVDDEELDFYPVFPIESFDPVNVKVSGFKIDDSIVGFIEESEESKYFGITGNAISFSEDSALEPSDETIGPVSESNSTNETTSVIPIPVPTAPETQVPSPLEPMPTPIPETQVPEEEPEIAPPVVGIEEFPEAENRPILDFPVKDYKTAVILVKFLDTESEPFTKEEAHDLIFEGQFQKFFSEQSYGRVKFSGDVFGWYTLQKDSSYTMGCGISASSELSKSLGVSPEDYDKIVFIGVGPDCPTGGYVPAYGGKWIVVNGRQHILGQAYYNIPFSWTNLDNVFSHEMGHALRAVHSNGLDCGDEIFIGECKKIEYGSYFDVMGAWDPYALHFSALNTARTGFLHPSEILEISESGTYTLNAIEDKKGKSKMATIPLVGLFLEYRRGLGFDSILNNPEYSKNQEGLLIYKDNLLLDADPSSLGWSEDMKSAALYEDFFFEDFFYGYLVKKISLSVINYTDKSITFDVDLFLDLECVRNPPEIVTLFMETDFRMSIPPGKSAYLSFEYANTDYSSCASSDFRIYVENESSVYPDYFSFNYEYSSSASSPGTVELAIPMIIVSEDTPEGEYDIPFTIENIDSGLKSTKILKMTIKE